jgi:hypothetical protein
MCTGEHFSDAKNPTIKHYIGHSSTANAKGETEIYVPVSSPECKTLKKYPVYP